METSRRSLIRTGILTGGLVVGSRVALDQRPSAAAPGPTADPFTLGVASGEPLPDGFVIWTRLAPDPLAQDGLGGMPSRASELVWQVATDERFTDVVQAGRVRTGPEKGHSVHVEVQGLRPGRPYFYRFRLGRHLSPAGRTMTAPDPTSMPASLAMSFASCSQFEHGWFTAYRRLAEDQPDLVLHLGDYQYEYRKDTYVSPSGNVRDHRGPETVTLANYRQRLAQYKTDPDLQAAHAVAPWLVVFDDHEVDNNWADEVHEKPHIPQPDFMERRAAAMRAYYENMPLRRSSLPSGPDMRLYRRLQWGRLANFHMLDTRQYRDDQACGDGYDDCPAADDPRRSLPGMQQERWLADGFAASDQRWDVLGQQVFFGRRDASADEDVLRVSMDAWDGYSASRDRVVRSWAGTRNPIVLTGDVHAHWGSEVLADWDDPDSEVLGSEFVTSSITSGGDGYDKADGTHPWAGHNPNLTFWTTLRGYVRTTITPEQFAVDYRCLPKVTTPGAPAFTRASFVVEDGVRGMRQTGDNPVPQARVSASSLLGRTARPAPPVEQIVRDTVRSETGH